mmetsp:Transcript_20960/g.53082  ORF Transcript_20960/g.53082 Transcript_20960/m.53082 type:complete len:437 (+) Transcript_20960:337-1647(+)
MNTEDLVSLGIGIHNHGLFGIMITVGASTRVSLKGEFTSLEFATFGLELFGCLADPSNFRIRVDDTRDRIIVHVTSLRVDDILNGSNTFFFGLVCEHGSLDHITDGADGRHVGSKVLIGHDHSTIGHLHTDLVQTELVGVGATSHRHQHHVGVDLLGGTALGRLDGELHLVAEVLGAGHLGGHLELDALASEHLLELLGDGLVGTGGDLGQELDHGHLGAETSPHGAELEADHTAADHHHLFGHLGERQCAGAAHDALLVDLDAGQRHHIRTGGDQDVLRGDLLFSAIGQCDAHLLGARDATRTLHVVHLVLGEQVLNTTGETMYNLLLGVHHLGNIHFDTTHFDAVLGKVMSGLMIEMSRMQQCLGRNATDVQARATQSATLLYTGNLEAQLGSLDGGHVATGSTTHDNDIIGATGCGVGASGERRCETRRDCGT